MAAPRAPKRNAAAIAGLPALLLGTWCGTALASADFADPCPDAAAVVSDLHEVLATDSVLAPMADTESKIVSESDDDAADSGDVRSEVRSPEFTTRLPGVSAHDMPRFRRHMFRTDI